MLSQLRRGKQWVWLACAQAYILERCGASLVEINSATRLGGATSLEELKFGSFSNSNFIWESHMQSSKEPHLAREPYVPDPCSSCMEITHFIHLLEVSKCCLNKHSFTFRTSMLLAKSTQDSLRHSLANFKSTSCTFSNTNVESHDQLTVETCNQYREWSGNSSSCTFHVWSMNFFLSWPSKLHLY